jgi:hypothetical protein
MATALAIPSSSLALTVWGRNAAEVMIAIRELGERENVLRSPREGIESSNAMRRLVLSRVRRTEQRNRLD